MKKSLKKIVTATIAAIIFALPTCLNASAAGVSITVHSSEQYFVRFAESIGTNTTTQSRKLTVTTSLYMKAGSTPAPNSGDKLLDQAYASGVVGSGGTIDSGEAKATKIITSYAYGSATLYNGTVTQSGQYGSASKIVEFI